jgi:pantothenate kinase-related protein Tda10
MDFPIVITQSDYNNYLTMKHQQELKVIMAIIKGFEEMER